MSSNYINNKEFYALLVDYKEKCKHAEENDLPKPRIPESIGTCFYMIATRLANKANFIAYTYKDEMISDGLENCVVAVESFNPEKSKNPFAYFTQIIWYAFLRRIEKEKKQTYVKYKSLENLLVDFSLEGETDGIINLDLSNDKMVPIIEKFEKKVKSKVKKQKAKGLEKFIPEDQQSEDNANN
jgi:hypothetical protein